MLIKYVPQKMLPASERYILNIYYESDILNISVMQQMQ